MPRISANDPRYQVWIREFLRVLAAAGWTTGPNMHVDTRFGTANAAEIREHAMELAALEPDVILAHGASTVRPLLQATRTVPIVFPIVADPVAAGFVESLARPGGNVTGFMTAEYGSAGKWLELLKEIAPRVTRVAVFRDPAIITGASQFAAIQAVSSFLKVDVKSWCDPAGGGRAGKRASLPLRKREFIKLLSGASAWPLAKLPTIDRFNVLSTVRARRQATGSRLG